MRISNRNTSRRFFLLACLIWVVYALLFVYNIFLGSVPVVGLVLQFMILMMLSGLVAFLWWIWKEAQY